VLASLVAAALLAPSWTPGTRSADAFAATRRGTVSYAVRTERRLWGREPDRRVSSASVIKALLLVSYLRDERVRGRPLRAADRRLLSPMIRWSQNAAASEIATRLGAAHVNRTAHSSGMPGFSLALPFWGSSQITAREETRFMLHIDRLMPARHRAYGMRLLRTVVHTQRWGIAEVVPRGWTLYFKSGWGSGLGRVENQVALLRRGRQRVAVAILTTAQGRHRYGTWTLRGIASRLLRRLWGPLSG
jgi:beta-lactamase class A